MINLRNPDIDQPPFVHKDVQPSHDLSILPNAPGQTEIGRNFIKTQNISASVEPGLSLNARHIISAPVETGLGLSVRHNTSGNIEAGRNLTVPLSPFVQNLSPMAAFQYDRRPTSQNLFHYSMHINVKLFIEIYEAYHLYLVLFIITSTLEC